MRQKLKLNSTSNQKVILNLSKILKMKKLFILVALFCLSSQFIIAQTEQVNGFKLATYNTKLNEPKSYIIPAVFTAYGFIALSDNGLRSLNITTNNEIREDHPNFNTSVDNYLQFSPMVATFALKLAGIHGEHNNKQSVRLYAESTLLMGVTVYALKKTTLELRPDGSDHDSFPSGHTALAFAAAEFMHQEFKNTNPIISYTGYLAAGATGVLRMYNNKHYLGDVLAGAGIGIITTKAAYWLDHKIFKSSYKK